MNRADLLDDSAAARPKAPELPARQVKRRAVVEPAGHARPVGDVNLPALDPDCRGRVERACHTFET